MFKQKPVFKTKKKEPFKLQIRVQNDLRRKPKPKIEVPKSFIDIQNKHEERIKFESDLMNQNLNDFLSASIKVRKRKENVPKGVREGLRERNTSKLSRSQNDNPNRRMFNPGAMRSIEKINDIEDNLNFSSHIKYSSPYFNHQLQKYSDVPYLEDAEIEYG